jgi:CBS domain-containing protein
MKQLVLELSVPGLAIKSEESNRNRKLSVDCPLSKLNVRSGLNEMITAAYKLPEKCTISLEFRVYRGNAFPIGGTIDFSEGNQIFFALGELAYNHPRCLMDMGAVESTHTILGGSGFFYNARGTILVLYDLRADKLCYDKYTIFIILPWLEKADGNIRLRRIKVQDILDEKAFPITADATMEYAADLLVLTNSQELMVVDTDGNFVGLISEYDLLENIIPEMDEIINAGGSLEDAYQIFIKNGENLSNQPIRRLVKLNPLTVSPQEELLNVAVLMSQSHIRRIAVVENGKFVGSISMADLCWALLSRWNGLKQEGHLKTEDSF